MKNGLKKLLGLGLAVSLALGCNGMTAFAKEDEFNGEKVYYYVLTTSDGASATTSYVRPATIETVVTVYYHKDGHQYSKQGAKATASIGGAQSTVSIGSGGGQVAGAKGEHYLTSGHSRWDDKTTIGNTW